MSPRYRYILSQVRYTWDDAYNLSYFKVLQNVSLIVLLTLQPFQPTSPFMVISGKISKRYWH